MPYITFATLLLISASGIFSIYRQLQVLQQNSYSVSLYFKWLKDSYATELAVSAVIYCVITISIIKDKLLVALIIAIIFMGLRIALNVGVYKKLGQKLAFTTRVKTLYITAIVILGVLVFVSTILYGTILAEICRTLCLILSSVTPSLTFIAIGVTYPVQKITKKK